MMHHETDRCQPVFIAGCGRSGTSLLRTLIDAHPDVYIPSESLFIPDYLRHGDRLPRRLLRFLLFHEPQLRCWYEGPPELGSNTAVTIEQAHRIMAGRRGASLWGQKTPRFVRCRELLDACLGPLRWILLYRDPRGVCASMRLSGQHTHSVSRACTRWQRDNREIVELVSDPARCPDNVLLVKYEELIQRYEDTLARVFRFLGLPPVSIDQLVENARPVFFPGSGFEINTVRDGVLPDPRRIEDWQSVLRPAEIAYIESACALEMEVLGYPRLASGTNGGFALADALRKLQDVRVIYRYLRYWPTYPLYTLLRKAVLAGFGGLRAA